MSGPGTLQLKRKRTEEPPKVLVIGPPNKRSATSLHYVLRSDRGKDGDAAKKEQSPTSVASPGVSRQSHVVPPKRFFELSLDTRGTKRKGVDDGVAVLVEKRVKSNHPADESSVLSQQGDVAVPEKSFKRPSRHAAVKPTNERLPPQNAADQMELEALAEYMHDFALDEVLRGKGSAVPRHQTLDTTPSHRKITPPKLSAQRSRELHRQRIASQAATARPPPSPSQSKTGAEMDIDTDTTYVYDTYILSSAAASPHDTDIDPEIGYLLLTSPAQHLLWEQTYLHSPLSTSDDETTLTDDEDENAEDYYGADYPEDELDEEDEFGRGSYGFRRGSDEEGWDEETDGRSGSEGEWERVMEPFRARGGAGAMGGRVGGAGVGE